MSETKTTIRSWRGRIIHESAEETIAKALMEAHAKDADLTRAVLTDADLTGAVLTGADLTGADLTGADLTGAVLTGADLTGAVLTGADLTGADLTGADLTDAVLTEIRDDFRKILDAAPHEVAGLRLALVEGRVDGSTYEGECACLVGTIANVRGVNYRSLATSELAPNSERPAERFFLAIHKGLKPEVWEPSRLAVQWIDEWTREQPSVPA